MSPRLQRLRAEIASDVGAFDRWAGELRATEPADAASCALVAVALHHAYGAVESALVRLSRMVDATEPEGPEWHQGLLGSMAIEIPGVRPALVGKDTHDRLHRLLAFRHFFRHAYAVELSAERLAEVRAAALDLAPLVARDFAAIDALLASLSAAGD